MIVVFSIVAVIALIALYDYFQSRSWQQVTSDARNDTVFAQRNKQYGAYQMRRNYNKQLALIIGGIVAGAGVLYAATRGNEVEKFATSPNTREIMHTLVIPKPDKKDADPIMRTKQESGPQQETQAFVEPRVTDRELEQTEITVPDPGTPVSDENNEGNGDDLPGGVPGDGGNGQGNTTTEEPPTDEPVKWVDEPACFPGGMDKLPPFLRDNLHYPDIAIQLGLEGKCYLKFEVSKVGDISDVKVVRGVEDCPECDKEAVRVVRSMPLWRPGKLNGRPVKSEFNLPITFKLQKN
jgi:protein TonB